MRIHTYAASFGDDLAAQFIEKFTIPGETVLDCFSGLGTTLIQSRKLHRLSIGIDVDPVACLIASVATQKYSQKFLENFQLEVSDRLLDIENRFCSSDFDENIWAPGAINLIGNIQLKVPNYPEIGYWFAPAQCALLSNLVWLANSYENIEPLKADLLKLSISSSIIRKWPNTLSLAMDIDHSRPHKANRDDLTITEQALIFKMVFTKTIRVLKLIGKNAENSVIPTVIKDDVLSGLSKINTNSIDYILTSPPYYNAIDYPRAHRFSEWWLFPDQVPLPRQSYLGLRSAAQLKGIVEECERNIPSWNDSIKNFRSVVNGRYSAICKYVMDLYQVIKEFSRVLRPGKPVTIILSNNVIQGHVLPFCEIVGDIMEIHGFSNVSIVERPILVNRRRYPFGIKGFNGLMHSEKVIHGVLTK